ncbi:hypothetical protein MBLNU230_g0177t1 [Neophaeotheca triangularis]
MASANHADMDMDMDMDMAVQRIAASINEQLPSALLELLRSGANLGSGPLRLECSLSAGEGLENNDLRRTRLASVDIRQPVASQPDVTTPDTLDSFSHPTPEEAEPAHSQYAPTQQRTFRPRIAPPSPVEESDNRPSKRRKATGGLRVGGVPSSSLTTQSSSNRVTRHMESDVRVFPQRKKRSSDNPALQPSTLEKFINGVWQNLYSGEKMDPAQVIEQWQAIQGTGQPKLLADTAGETEIAARDSNTAISGMYTRINILTRKLSQTSKTCRSLEVIVQAYWVQCFDDRVTELSASLTKDKAKKTAIAEACVDFSWSEKELRNKMGIWRGYFDICNTGGWAALVFAGHGLYRFCKYRAVAFTEDTFQTLKNLRPRFEVAADTLHPNWRHLTSIVGASTERKYPGHPHDWVVAGPNNEPVPLHSTYTHDPDFSYTHLDGSVVDEEAWGLFDPRVIYPADTAESHKCLECHERQSEDVCDNACACFPNLYGANRHSAVPVQVFRTPKGCNNGLVACCAFERGTAVGEFVGQITSGLAGLDVMVGQTDKAAYQIWQGKQGNHTRFVNHSCQPNSQFERFVWLGTQRIVLVSKGIEAGEEVTVDYSDTYWKNLDKVCQCGSKNCRYWSRARILTPPESM